MSELAPEALIEKVRSISGLRVFDADKSKLSDWISRRLTKLKLANFSEYFIYLSEASDLSEERTLLSELLTTGETYFMRDQGQMALLSRVIFPELIQKRRSEKHLRIWAAACATGEEVYSMVILLNQLIPDILGWNIEIIGTDINSQFIQAARIASYGDWAFRGCDDAFKESYFHRCKSQWILNEDIKKQGQFFECDLVGDALPDPSRHLADIDFILCRNLFIYLDAEAIVSVTKKLAMCLRDQGILMVAQGELYVYVGSELRVNVYPESIVYEKTTQEFLPPSLVSREHIGGVDPHLVHYPVVERVKESASIKELVSADDELKKAWRYANRGMLNQALSLGETISLKYPMLAEVHYLLAIIAVERGQSEVARQELRKAIYIDPYFIAAHIELMNFYIHHEELGLAVKACAHTVGLLDDIPEDQSIPYLGGSSRANLSAYLKNLQSQLIPA